VRKRELLDLCLDRGNNVGMTMTQAGDGCTAASIQILTAFGIV
jgi:hypothetical protein